MRIKLFLLMFLLSVTVSCTLFYVMYVACNRKEHFAGNSYDDTFFSRMSNADLHARGMTEAYQTSQYYERLYHKSMESFRDATITNIVELANAYLQPYPLLHNIPWNVQLFSNNVENGFPHTLAGSIKLPKSFAMTCKSDVGGCVETLIHEKIHLFQKAYPSLTQRLIIQWGFVPSTYHDPLQRNNPDLDKINYNINGKTIYQRYNNTTPVSLLDSSVISIDDYGNMVRVVSATDLGFPSSIQQYEHPYEIMACLLSQIITNQLSKKEEHNEKVQIAVEWLEYLKTF